MPTWKKILLEGDSIPASDVEAGALGTGSFTIDGALGIDTINEYTSGEGVTVDNVNLKDGEVHMLSGQAASISRAWLGV